MRLWGVFALAAAFALMPFAGGEDKKELKRPPLDAKEWKKQKSGLEIWDVKEGKGEAVKEGATVVVHYTGWLTDEKATKFDSSKDRDMPFEAILKPGTTKSVIKGWNEGVPGMKPGGVRRLKIPAELAYGEKGRGKLIPPNSVLIFEVELIEIK
jgi:FKBP-type peptidyl-prolyl cis-trans isomerase